MFLGMCSFWHVYASTSGCTHLYLHVFNPRLFISRLCVCVCVCVCVNREVKVHVSKGGMAVFSAGIILNQFTTYKKKSGPMDQMLYTLSLTKVCMHTT